MRVGHSYTKTLNCNWKVFWENFNECLHCPNIHPELSDLVPIYGRASMARRDDPNWRETADDHAPEIGGGLKEGAQSWSMAGSAQGRRDVGGGGRDVMRGTAKDDVLNGGGGADQVLGLAGKDAVRGGGGNDRVAGGGGDDVARGDGGKDRLDGRGGNDDLFGGAGADRLFGGAGADELRGGGGKDQLDGGAGADKLFGDAANDRLDGGKGKDALTGGAGKDVFFFTRGDGADTVRDWQDGRDKIEIGRGANSFAKLEIDQKGKNALIEYGKRGDVIKLLKTDADDLDASDFIF